MNENNLENNKKQIQNKSLENNSNDNLKDSKDEVVINGEKISLQEIMSQKNEENKETMSYEDKKKLNEEVSKKIKNWTLNPDDDVPDELVVPTDEELKDLETKKKQQENKEKKVDKMLEERKKKAREELEKTSNNPNLDLEKRIITILINSDEPFELINKYNLKPEYFISKMWKTIFKIILDLSLEKNNVDLILLKDKFEKQAKNQKEIKEFEWFFNLKGFIAKKNLFFDYTELLKENYNLNYLENLSKKLTEAILNKNFEKVQYYKYEIENFEFNNWVDDNPDIGLIDNKVLSEQALEYFNGGYKHQATKLKTWFKDFDNMIGGFEKGTMTVFLARPSVWKSVALINSMYGCIKENKANCLYVSAEMYAKYLLDRWIAINTDLAVNKYKYPNRANDKEKEKIRNFIKNYSKEELAHFFYQPTITARDIEIEAKKLIAKTWKPLDAIFIDYLGKLYPNNMNMDRSRNDIVTDISKELFELGGKLNVAIVTASQLNRWNARNADQESLVKVSMSDIRDSGAVAQDADVLIWLTRDVLEWRECKTEQCFTDFNWDIIKNRNGETWEFALSFYPQIQKLKNPTDEFSANLTEAQLKMKNDAIKQENIIKSIIEDNEVYSEVKDIF